MCDECVTSKLVTAIITTTIIHHQPYHYCDECDKRDECETLGWVISSGRINLSTFKRSLRVSVCVRVC